MSNNLLRRRGHSLGTPPNIDKTLPNDETLASFKRRWAEGRPIKLHGYSSSELKEITPLISQSQKLYHAILDQQECNTILAHEPYASKLSMHFDALGSSYNEGDDQEIETVFFDAADRHQTICEDLWVKISWLSFYEQDKSLRFRFSFGVDFEEDVARDRIRQKWASQLAEDVFPESRIVTDYQALLELLRHLLDSDDIKFVERIVYFNAPEGGAYFHHDRERGHAGVVYAQITGRSFWLALPKVVLVAEIQMFVKECCAGTVEWPANISPAMRKSLAALVRSNQQLTKELDSLANSALIQLINETEEFVQRLTSGGHGLIIEPGDFLILPQQTDELCCWHSVFCHGAETGQALSFAVRGD